MESSAQSPINVGFKIRRLAASISKARLFAYQTARAYLSPVRGIRILFSANEGLKQISGAGSGYCGKSCIFEINPRFGGNLGVYFFKFLRRLKSKAA